MQDDSYGKENKLKLYNQLCLLSDTFWTQEN